MLFNKALRVREYPRLPMRSIRQGYVFNIKPHPFGDGMFVDFRMKLDADLARKAKPLVGTIRR